jgi:hypothetical protein
VVSIFVSQPGISSHSYLALLNAAMLVPVEVCDGGTHLVRGSGEANRHQDADARKVALAGAGSARMGAGVVDARDVSVERSGRVHRPLCGRKEPAALKGVRR